MTEVYIPIAPQVEQGVITVKIQTITQINRENIEIEIEILVGFIFVLKGMAINERSYIIFVA